MFQFLISPDQEMFEGEIKSIMICFDYWMKKFQFVVYLFWLLKVNVSICNISALIIKWKIWQIEKIYLNISGKYFVISTFLLLFFILLFYCRFCDNLLLISSVDNGPGDRNVLLLLYGIISMYGIISKIYDVFDVSVQGQIRLYSLPHLQPQLDAAVFKREDITWVQIRSCIGRFLFPISRAW